MSIKSEGRNVKFRNPLIVTKNIYSPVQATWAFKVFDFDDDNDITKYDLIDVIDKLTSGSELMMDEKSQICDIVSVSTQKCLS